MQSMCQSYIKFGWKLWLKEAIHKKVNSCNLLFLKHLKLAFVSAYAQSLEFGVRSENLLIQKLVNA